MEKTQPRAGLRTRDREAHDSGGRRGGASSDNKRSPCSGGQGEQTHPPLWFRNLRAAARARRRESASFTFTFRLTSGCCQQPASAPALLQPRPAPTPAHPRMPGPRPCPPRLAPARPRAPSAIIAHVCQRNVQLRGRYARRARSTSNVTSARARSRCLGESGTSSPGRCRTQLGGGRAQGPAQVPVLLVSAIQKHASSPAASRNSRRGRGPLSPGRGSRSATSSASARPQKRPRQAAACLRVSAAQ